MDVKRYRRTRVGFRVRSLTSNRYDVRKYYGHYLDHFVIEISNPILLKMYRPGDRYSDRKCPKVACTKG